MSEQSSYHLETEPLPRQVKDFGRVSLLVGLISLAFWLILTFVDHYAGFRSLLFGMVYWLAISLGALAFTMISHLTGGGWGVVMRRFAEAAFLNIPWLLVVFLVLCLGLKLLFPWGHMQEYADDPKVYAVLKHREILYSPGIFIVRVLLYFGIWMLFAIVLRVGSLRLDQGENPRLRRTLRKFSSGGLILFFLTTMFYAMDFFMSRETNWYSSILGFITDVGMGMSGMALVSLSVCYFANRKPIKDVLDPQHLNDLGNILLATVILWMYTSYAQWLIQWNGVLREDSPYYAFRGLGPVHNGWRYIAGILVLCQFFLPFFLLLQKPLKRNPKTFSRICIWLLFMRFVEALWVVAPAGAHRWSEPGRIFPFYDLAAWLGVGGIWMYRYLRILGSVPMLPQNATDQPRIVSHGAHGTPAHSI